LPEQGVHLRRRQALSEDVDELREQRHVGLREQQLDVWRQLEHV
jgi:hypothetical protein